MDSFTENILARARQRAQLLTNDKEDCQEVENKVAQSKILTPQNENPKITKTPNKNKDKCIQDSPKNSPQRTKTLSFQKENLNMEIKVTSSDDVRVEVEFEEHSDSEEAQHNGDGLRKDVKERLNRLGKLYAGGEDADLSSPIHRTEEKFMSECKSESTPVIDKLGGKFLRGLANLADEINHWEDDMKTSAKKGTQALKWDKAVLDSLESQGFQKKTEESKLVYNYTTPDKNDKKKCHQLNETRKEETTKPHMKYTPKTVVSEKSTKVENSKPVVKFPSKTVIAEKVSKFESPQKKATPDPSCLSISERKALFEKNQGEVLLPKAPFGMSIPLKDNKSTSKTSNTNKGLKSHLNSPSKQSPAENLKNDTATNKLVTFENVKLKKVRTNDDSPIKYKNIEESSRPTIKSVVKKFTPSSPLRETTTKTVSYSKTIDKINDSSKIETSMKTSVPAKPVESAGKANVAQSGGIASTMEALFQKKNTISEDQIQGQVKEQRMKEMAMLMNRFKRKEVQEDVIEEEEESFEEEETDKEEDIDENTPMFNKATSKILEIVESPALKRLNEESAKEASPSPRRSRGKRSSVSPKVAAVLGDVKRIKVSPAKPGGIYPNLSDIETGKETETEDGFESSSAENSSIASYSGTLETSFGKEILEAVCKNQTPVKRTIYDDSTASDVSDVLGDMDDYLDEALEYENEQENMGPTPPKQIKSKDTSFASHSFHYKNYSPNVSNFKSPMKIRVSTEKADPVQVVDGEDVLPLTYTVSFYRKQTNTTASPSATKVVSRQEEDSLPEPDKQQEILAKIKSLQTEVQKLQLNIAQTSQALNLCNNTLEFMGSTEQVEAEKVLLISTHRRQAILNEIQRLKVEETLRPQNHSLRELPIEKGVLTISEIILPLKKDYVRALAAAGGKGHHVICLVKCGEEVVSSKLVSTVATNIKNPCYELTVPGTISLKNIYNDSTITLEVYCLQAQEELLPHDVKYHIRKNKATPKKNKHESLLSRPIKESPGGPQAVRSPSFALMGYVVFSVHNINRKSWSLNNTPSMSPLEGSVEMIVSCELTASVEYRGFLTMFEDISGFGAWHRRWCLLKGDALSYWKYPDDEKKMLPINSIDLRSCITKEVGPVSRDICARLHTFLIETHRPPLPQDKETLTTICKKDKTIIRHLLSADTKEERIRWCAQFNTILLANKICGNNA